MWGSVKLSLVTAVISVIVGTVAGYAVVTSRGRFLKQTVLAASGVLANFGGIPLAFCFVATVGTAGEVVNLLHNGVAELRAGHLQPASRWSTRTS